MQQSWNTSWHSGIGSPTGRCSASSSSTRALSRWPLQSVKKKWSQCGMAQNWRNSPAGMIPRLRVSSKQAFWASKTCRRVTGWAGEKLRGGVFAAA